MAKKEEHISREMLNYIEAQLDKGFTMDQIKEKLHDSGHSYDFVDRHVSHYKKKGLLSKLGIAAIVLALVFVIILLVVRSGRQSQETPNVLIPKIDAAGCYDMPKDQQGGCLKEVNFNQAILQKDISKCKDTNSVDSCRDNVVMAIAFSTSDILSCDKISNPMIKSSCRDNLIMSEALGKKDSKLCIEISNPIMASSCKERTA
jgi:hypothetical protein